MTGSMNADFANLFALAVKRRDALIRSRASNAVRLFSGAADGCDGVFVDLYASGAVLIVYDGATPRSFDARRAADVILQQLSAMGVSAVYHKPFARDRSRMGSELPPEVTDPQPLAGEVVPESLLIHEHAWKLEVRLYDGLSTGLFLDQRDNRKWVHDWLTKRPDASMLNTFAYTCAFSVAAGVAGAQTTSVDVSGRYLDWGKRNFAHNGIEITENGPHRFARMDTFEFLSYAKRKGLAYDLIVLDPPSFGSGSKKKGIRPWSSVDHYARLVAAASALLKPRGAIFASTNTRELCRPNRLDREIVKALGRAPRWLDLPDPPIDFARDHDRFAARAFVVK